MLSLLNYSDTPVAGLRLRVATKTHIRYWDIENESAECPVFPLEDGSFEVILPTLTVEAYLELS
ncbi:MAG: hypothetical protein HQL31_07290 [Planctomycetes bacterium]|nr:hypothetical protein [Planctomycetota bacterium]